MRICGHTMGTPELTVIEAVALFARLGFEGIEIICTEGYRCGITLNTPAGELRALRDRAAAEGVAIAGLVPYMKAMNSPDASARGQAIADLRRAVDIAEQLGCPLLRVFGGLEVPAEQRAAALERLASALQEASDYAHQAGVNFAIENHMDTMATSAAGTMEIVRAVARPNVGVIYDQANLSFMGSEPYEAAIALQWPHIFHVHAKDFFWQGSERRAAVVGEGIVPWPAIVGELTRRGYAGYYSLEYERRWFPDQLPPAEVGMKACADYIRRLIP